MHMPAPIVGRLALTAVLLLLTSSAYAYPEYRDNLQREAGVTGLGCITCHNNHAGGGGCGAAPCLNSFGASYLAAGPSMSGTWFRIAADDSDGDGYSNQLELGDLDGDGVSDTGVLLSGPGSNVGDLDECALGMVSCRGRTRYCHDLVTCSAAERPSYECAADEPAPSLDPYIDEPWTRAPIVELDQWTSVDNRYDYNPGVPSACGPSANSVWLRFPGGCLGDLILDVRDERGVDTRDFIVGAYSTGSSGSSCSGESVPVVEQSCRLASEGVPQTGPLLRIMGTINGQVRLTCEPRSTAICTQAPGPEFEPDHPIWDNPPSTAAACSRRNPSCRHAAPVSDETVTIDVGAGYGCDSLDGTWLEYTATCTGRAVVRSVGTWDDVDRIEPGVTVALLRGACPVIGDELACRTVPSHDERRPGGRENVELETKVLFGHRIFVRVSGTSTQQERVGFSCIPEADESYCELCAESAECEVGTSGVLCHCPIDMLGDGVSILAGGEGCRPPTNDRTPCLEAGLNCADNAYCIHTSLNTYCLCADGYSGSGFHCVEDDGCAGSPCRGTYQVCADTLAGHDCLCGLAYSVDPVPDPANPSLSCTLVCGDGRLAPGEFCDDGNYIADDGCSPTCEIERNFTCSSQFGISECRNTCGDGLVDVNEDYFCDRYLDIDAICDCRAAAGAPVDFPVYVPGLFLLLVAMRRRRR